MALSSAKFQNIRDIDRKAAMSVLQQLKGSTAKRSATVELEGLMLKLLRSMAGMVAGSSGVFIAPLDKELSPSAASRILGISRPMVVERMEEGKLPFRFEGRQRRCKLEDVLKLREKEDKRAAALHERLAKNDRDRNKSAPSNREIDELVLGMANEPHRRAINVKSLVKALTTGDPGPWTVHLTAFFTELRPELILKFAKLHGIAATRLASSYDRLKKATGEANPALEKQLEQLTQAA